MGSSEKIATGIVISQKEQDQRILFMSFPATLRLIAEGRINDQQLETGLFCFIQPAQRIAAGVEEWFRGDESEDERHRLTVAYNLLDAFLSDAASEGRAICLRDEPGDVLVGDQAHNELNKMLTANGLAAFKPVVKKGITRYLNSRFIGEVDTMLLECHSRNVNRNLAVVWHRRRGHWAPKEEYV